MKTIFLKHNLLKKSNIITSLIIGQLMVLSSAMAIDVSINSSQNLTLASDVTYNFQTTPSSISFKVGSPLVCVSINSSSAPIVLGINDPNDIAITTLNNGVLSTVYDLTNNKISLFTDNTIKCANKDGLIRENIFTHGFENGVNDLSLTLLNSNTGSPFVAGTEFTDQQIVSYQYVIENFGQVPLEADMEEYYRLDPTKPFFSGVAGDDWSCSVANTVSGTTSTCGTSATGEATVSLNNAIVDPGEQLIINVTRTAEVPAGTIGVTMDLLAAAFTTDTTDTVIDNNYAFITFGTTDNNAPTISAISNSVIFEDSNTGIINFTVGDIETNVSSLTVTASTSSSAVIPVSNIVISGTGANRSVVVTPVANMNTPIAPVTISLLVNDGFTTTQEQFTVDISSVNDEPSFTLQTISDWPAGTSGLKTMAAFLENINLGASPDESSQNIASYNVNITSDPNGVILGGFEPSITSGVLSYGLSGSGGTATVDVFITDDGGTSNGGNDTSLVVTFTITVLNTLPTISTVADIVIDEDSSSAVIPFTISDAETADNALTMTASSSPSGIVDIAGIVFTGTGGSRNVQITPISNQNTVDSGVVTITLTVGDGSDTFDTTFDVTINPINDAPSFALDADIVWITGTTGLKQHSNYANTISMGPTADEDSAQNVSQFNVTVTGDPIFGGGGEPSFDTSGSLAYLLDGTSGTATVEVTLQDDGGTASGGADTSSPSLTFTIQVQ